MPTDVETLMEMGFTENGANRALAKTGYKGVQLAMDWLFAHTDDPDLNDPFEAPKGHVLGAPGPSAEESSSSASGEGEAANTPMETETKQAMSFKCEDCGKLLRSEMEVQAHAARTQHSNFAESTEEIKPLTAEEKAEQLNRLQEKMKQKRMEREAKEKEEKIQREKERRTTGKDMSQAKQKMEELEMKKIAEERRREKEEARLARQRVKEQIEKDKRDRAEKFAKKPTPDTAPPAQVPSSSASQPAKPKEYDTCRLQIRTPDGAPPLTNTFNAKESLAAVRLFVQLKTKRDEFTMMTTFPSKTFTDDDMEKPLSELNLVPTATLMLKYT